MFYNISLNEEDMGVYLRCCYLAYQRYVRVPSQAYCNIVAGACFALGLRFAGSGSEEARDVALHYVRLLLAVGAKSVAELAGRSTLEACMCVCLLAAGMVCPAHSLSTTRYDSRTRAGTLPCHQLYISNVYPLSI